MSSTITQYSALIDTTYPIPGVDNDTQGFRDNSILISQSFARAATEITALQISQADVITRLNDATVVGDNYATIIANTVTTQVINSLTNGAPDIVTPTVRVWYNTTITNDITNLQTQISTNTNNLQSQINVNTGDITALQSATVLLAFSVTNIWNTLTDVSIKVNTNTNDIIALQQNLVTVNNTATYAWDQANYLINLDVAGDVSDLKNTSTTLWNVTFGASGLVPTLTGVTAFISSASSYRSVPNPAVAGAVGNPGDKMGMIYADANYIYVCTSDYNGSTPVWVRTATTAW